ncbi:hypothetical protein J5TS2_33180 [Brevibacillus halotolerans]|nr:hypothetical protein J5TS2_33180 [Brevibacillus halotolerans]
MEGGTVFDTEMNNINLTGYHKASGNRFTSNHYSYDWVDTSSPSNTIETFSSMISSKGQPPSLRTQSYKAL